MESCCIGHCFANLPVAQMDPKDTRSENTSPTTSLPPISINQKVVADSSEITQDSSGDVSKPEGKTVGLFGKKLLKTGLLKKLPTGKDEHGSLQFNPLDESDAAERNPMATQAKTVSIWQRVMSEGKDKENDGDPVENDPTSQPMAASRERRGTLRFKNLARMIRANLRWTGEEPKKEKSSAPSAFVVKDGEDETAIVFDKSMFKAKNKIYGGLTMREKAILTVPPVARTEEDLGFLRDLVDRLKCFDKYNSKIRRELARVINYEKFSSGRVIIQQGHIGMSFYFIASGTVLIEISQFDRNTGKKKSEVVGELSQGASFGELALVHNIKRTATIVCKVPCTFLRVDKEDFENVLLKCYQREWNERKHTFTWIKQLQMWTDAEKEICCKISQIVEYAPDEVVFDGNTATEEPDYLYFIISGEVRLVREIQLAYKYTIHGKKYNLLSTIKRKNKDIRKKFGKKHATTQRSAYLPEKHTWTISVMGQGFYFSVGENFKHTFVVSKTRCEVLQIPRAQFIRNGYSRQLDKMRDDLNKAMPSEKQLFNMYFTEAKWDNYKHDLVNDVISRSKIPRTTEVSDVPYAIRMESWRIGTQKSDALTSTSKL